MKRLSMAILAILMVVIIAGCGGGGGKGDGVNPISLNGTIEGTGSLTSSDGEHTDGSHYDKVYIKPTYSGYVYVYMDSTEVDSYVAIYRGTVCNSDTLITDDDDSGYDSNAYCSFYASAGQTYTVKFTSYGPGDDFGVYSYEISNSSGYSMKSQPKVNTSDNDSSKAAVDPSKTE